MLGQENSNFLTENFDSSQKSHDIPLDHLDYKYVNACEDVRELEKIYRILCSGVEGKFPDLENCVAKKIELLNPVSRALRKDLPIKSKMGIPKNERTALDDELNEFVNKIDNIGKVFEKSAQDSENFNDESLPAIRNKATTIILDPKNTKTESDLKKPVEAKKSTKSPKPKDYSDWAKIEKMLDNSDESEDDSTKKSDSTKKKFDAKVVTNKTQINGSNATNNHVKDLPKSIVDENIDESLKELKADQEKCKGNESFKCQCFEEALHYYTKSIQFMPTAASFNNRAMTYLKLEKWDLAIEDCNFVLKYELSNLKALMRRSTAYLKKKKYTDAETDIDLVLSIEENNKKALELKGQISEQLEKGIKDEATVKSKGGKRLQIEESSDEEIEEKLENIILNNNGGDGKPSVIEVKDKFTGTKTAIKISEVESEDCEESDQEEEKVVEKVEPAVKVETTSAVKIELPANIVVFKDRANSQYASGQYSDALEFYTFAIDALKSEKTNNLALDIYFKNTLSILYNNRASCHQKICAFKESIIDCNHALSVITTLTNLMDPTDLKALKIKLMLKKSTAYETLEKFKDAFLECEELMKLDHNNRNVRVAYNRLRNILKETGEFEKIKKVVDDQKPVAKPEVKKMSDSELAKNRDQLYNDYKTKGNEYVKKGEYEYAVGFYTKCIELDAKNIIGYLNRSLCYVKMNQPELAVADSGFVLERDANNVKGLYRRASAYKILKKYELCARDLKRLLGLEPNNQIAVKDLKEVSELLVKIGGPKKVMIKEVSPKSDSAEKKMPEVLAEPKKEVVMEKKVVPTKIGSTNPIPATVPIRPVLTFTKISNGYEFLQGWNSINPRDIDSYSRLLLSMNVADLPTFIGSKLDDDMLTRIIKSIQLLSSDASKPDFKAVEYLKSLTRTQRFNVTKLFLDRECGDLIRGILSKSKDSEGAEFVKSAFGI